MWYVILRRFIEISGFCALFSICLALMSKSTHSMVVGLVPIGMIILTILYVLLNVNMLRRCYYDIMGIIDYYTGNIIACLVFATINIIMCVLCSDVVYS